MNHARRLNLFALIAICLGSWLPGRVLAAGEEGPAAPGWTKETLDLVATMPVQHNGRVKPLETLAGLNMLMINGKRSLLIDEEEGIKLKPSAWLLQCFFFPEQAKEYRCIRIENDGVLTALGLESRKKRDWYTYNELAPAKAKLSAVAMRASQKETADRDPVERQVLKLHQDLRNFESLVEFLDPIRQRYPTGTSESLRAIFGEHETSSLSQVVAKMGQLRELGSTISQEGGEEFEAVGGLLRALDTTLGLASGGPHIFPPTADAENPEEWWTIADVLIHSFNSEADYSKEAALLAGWEQLEAKKSDPAAFQAELSKLHLSLVGQTALRGEYDQIPLEVELNRFSPFWNALAFYLLGFLCLAVTWLAPRSRIPLIGLWGSVSIATILLIAGIVVRCIIRHRPPVVTLFDTILFITAVVVVVSLIMEGITRQKIGIGVATVLGVIGMFLAGRYEFKEIASAGDTMSSVVAVLDTNYYLAIHVTTIAMGYAGGLLASGIAHVWILGHFFGYRKGDKAFYKSVTRMTYGIVCFSLLFAIFGTIMGGVWANDSWGRFWGWDPKENGALLICLWQLLVLHARMGGYVRDRGLAVMTVVGGVVVSVSWWGVNLLNVGLHSYGFTSGVAQLLMLMWGIEAVVILLAGIDKLRSGGGSGPPALAQSA